MTGTPRHAGRPGQDALTVAELLSRDSTSPPGSAPPEVVAAESPAVRPPRSSRGSIDGRQWRRAPARPTRRQLVIAATVAAVVGVVTVAALTGRVPPRPSPGSGASSVARISLTTSQVQIGKSYLATAAGFLPGEQVLFSWTGPTNGAMGTFPADSSGNTGVPGPILERDPPGSYQIIATGLSSGRRDSAPLQVLAPP